MKAIEYVSPSGEVVALLVPWGDGSGNIPPPFIEFHGGERFVYLGDRSPTPENVETPCDMCHGTRVGPNLKTCAICSGTGRKPENVDSP